MGEFAEQLLQERKTASRRGLAACALAGAALLALATAGCTSGNGPMFSNLPPALGGLPADTPARPAADQTSFPAVHDMPPPRSTATLTPEQVKAVEAEIAFARARQKEQAGAPPPAEER